MEVVILNGITQTAATGLPKTAEGLNALMQRAYNRICLKRGAFCYDRVLGSRFYMLNAADEHAEERALRYAQAALSYAAEIPAGTVCAASGENAVEYETTEAAVLPAGALTVTAAAQAVLGGRRGNAAKGAVNTLITPPAGIESVTNDVSFTGGADKEDDEALRTRLLRCFYALPNGSNTETYRRAALMTPGVKSVQVVPRANGVNTVAVYLYGDNGAVTDEVLGKVGETLEKLKEISVDVTVAAAVAVRKPVTVYVKPKDGCAFEDAKASCTAAITAYLNAFEVGEPFVTAGLIHAVMETGVAQNCTVPASVADFTPNAGEIVTAGAVNVLETQ